MKSKEIEKYEIMKLNGRHASTREATATPQLQFRRTCHCPRRSLRSYRRQSPRGWKQVRVKVKIVKNMALHLVN